MKSHPTNRDGEVEIRDDEEQARKLEEIIGLLVAAGYFRARIKGLSPFDKIIGGMTWCIEICNFDIDVDLLFNDNQTIGQKIALTERIVMVLPQMKCPHPIEPHQIQGLDAIHIFPVIQWMVKKALETKAEYDDANRRYSVAEFYRNFTTPLQEKVSFNSEHAAKVINNIKDIYGPKRKWKRRTGITASSVSDSTRLTLMEYGENVTSLKPNDQKDEIDGSDDQVAEVEEMMSKLDVANQTSNKLSAVHVSSIVSGGAQEIITASQKFNQLQQNLHEEMFDDNILSRVKLLARLESQRETLLTNSDKLQNEEKRLVEEERRLNEDLINLKIITSQLKEQIKQVDTVDTTENEKILNKLSQLVQANEITKKSESLFKENCRKEAEQLKTEIKVLEEGVQEAHINDSLQQKYLQEKEKLIKMRKQLAKKTRKVEMLKRSIDDIPGRAELSQYQKRFVELYNEIDSAVRETGQFHNMHDTLEHSKSYMERELTLLNSILDNMSPALDTNSTLEDYVHQLDVIVDGIRVKKVKLEQRRAEEKACKARLASELSHLQELNRQYATTVHLLSQELSKNEQLQDKLDAL